MAKERVVDSCEVVRVSIFVIACRPTRQDSKEHISIYTVNGEPLFFQHFDGPFYPTLRLLHKCKSKPPLVDRCSSASA